LAEACLASQDNFCLLGRGLKSFPPIF